MVSPDTQNEIEEYLGTVPSWLEGVADPAADHSWGIVRDFQLGDSELSHREKALVGLGAAAAIQCPYCIHFHTEEAKLEEASEGDIEEAVSLAAGVRYFSTVLHGMEVDQGAFVEETGSIVEHIKNQQAAAPSDD